MVRTIRVHAEPANSHCERICRTFWALDSRRISILFSMIARIGNMLSVESTRLAKRRNCCFITMARRFRARWVQKWTHHYAIECFECERDENSFAYRKSAPIIRMRFTVTHSYSLAVHIRLFLSSLFFIHIRRYSCFCFLSLVAVRALQVNVTLKKPGTKLEHQGIKIELIGK